MNDGLRPINQPADTPPAATLLPPYAAGRALAACHLPPPVTHPDGCSPDYLGLGAAHVRPRGGIKVEQEEPDPSNLSWRGYNNIYSKKDIRFSFFILLPSATTIVATIAATTITAEIRHYSRFPVVLPFLAGGCRSLMVVVMLTNTKVNSRVCLTPPALDVIWLR
ncbi:hypothetical protein E2C01_035838 [Portunus trituberculatus]|uniref:Uncharacterized protein n=1 Tax=Portunus trituberculatus TaxID=210409 RepID=A0A5B7F708_PORTR|nr:hypothetical protein [Portunus trituberculatus]